MSAARGAWVNEYRFPRRVNFEVNKLRREGWIVTFSTRGRLLLEHGITRESVALQIPEGYPFVAPTIRPARSNASWGPWLRLDSLISQSASAASEP